VNVPDAATILVVDDDADTRDMMTMWLHFEGYEVRVASNGQEALKALQQEVPAAMVVDLHMPVMDGAELRHRQQQQRPEIANVPFILVSAGHDTEQVGRDLGVTDAIPKPFDATRLLRVLDTVCHRHH
jgi:CheY-like chemotaxis protein